ncbi:MAG TPA: methyltransferase domain-containing protein [Chitinophagaceae bacterium]|nr:methyltransferase domain-containing protein [Chitinophagaceae bacterium]
MPWNPDIYNQFKEERFAPFYDLLTFIKPLLGASVIDLGCGTGELTGKLADALPGSQVLGIDASAQMLQECGKFANAQTVFKLQAIEDIINGTGKWDVVFSNAALQWINGHETLLPAVIGLLKPGGQLAVQVPSNHHHATHTLIRTLASAEPYKTALDGFIRQSPVLSIEQYAQILFDEGGKEITVFEKAYPHILQDVTALCRWTQGTALVPYMERLPEELKGMFLKEYEEQLAWRFPASPVFYPFKRTLLYAVF